MNDEEWNEECAFCGEWLEGAEQGYTLCEDCGCDEISEKNDACYLAASHGGPCVFKDPGVPVTDEDVPVTDEELADALASIGKAAHIVPEQMGMLTYG